MNDQETEPSRQTENPSEKAHSPGEGILTARPSAVVLARQLVQALEQQGTSSATLGELGFNPLSHPAEIQCVGVSGNGDPIPK